MATDWSQPLSRPIRQAGRACAVALAMLGAAVLLLGTMAAPAPAADRSPAPATPPRRAAPTLPDVITGIPSAWPRPGEREDRAASAHPGDRRCTPLGCPRRRSDPLANFAGFGASVLAAGWLARRRTGRNG